MARSLADPCHGAQTELQALNKVLDGWDRRLALKRQLRIDVSKVKESILRLRMRLHRRRSVFDSSPAKVRPTLQHDWSLMSAEQSHSVLRARHQAIRRARGCLAADLVAGAPINTPPFHTTLDTRAVNSRNRRKHQR